MKREAILFVSLAVASPVLAAGITAKWAGDPDYQQCFASTQNDPKDGHRFATDWRNQGGGPAADHCLAVAMLSLGYYQESAQRLDDLAGRLEAADPLVAAELHGQAANAWSLAAKPEQARLAQSAALKLRPDDVELLIDRSVSLAALGAFWDAVDDLSRATDLAPKRPDILALRASAYRRLESLDLAEDDIARALALEPGHLDSLLERGIIRQLKGDRMGARRDWLAVVRSGGESPAAEAARKHLERLDLKVR